MAQPSGGLESWALWAGTVGMAAGTLYFLWQGRSVRDPRHRKYYVITTFIPAVAAASYFAMATGFGVITVEVSGGMGTTKVYWARYADWLITTPLLLLDLCLLAGADRNTIYTLLGLDVFMIGTGLVGALATRGQVYRIAWWAISTGALLVLLYYLLGTLGEQAASRSADVAALFEQLRSLTLVLWVVYPVVWLFGTEGGLEIIPIGVETAAFAALDLTAKVGFGVLLLRSRTVLAAASAGGEGTAAGGD
ncbi:MAG: bacteriorhodopsin [Haloferacaceae archaeon]